MLTLYTFSLIFVLFRRYPHSSKTLNPNKMRTTYCVFQLFLPIALKFQISRSQSVHLSVSKCQLFYYHGDTVELQAFLNTSGTDKSSWPLDNIVLNSSSSVCTVNITKQGCEHHDTSLCGYCDHQADNGYYINFYMTLERDNTVGYTIFWYGNNDRFAEDQAYFSHLPYKDLFNRRHFIGWVLLPVFLFNNQSRSYGFKYAEHSVPRNNHLFKNIYVGTTEGIFASMTQSEDTVSKPLILLTGISGKCQYMCQSIADMLNLQNIVTTVTSTIYGTNFTIKFYNISKAVAYYAFPEPKDLSQTNFLYPYYNEALKSLTIIFNNSLSFSLVAPINIDTCVNKNIWNFSQPDIKLAGDCPSGPSVKNGLIRRWTSATCRCLLVNSVFPFTSVQWHDHSGQPIGTPGAYSDLTIFTTKEKTSQYTCRSTIFSDSTKGVTFIPKVYDAPSVLQFTANGKRTTIDLNVGDNVTFYCQVMSTDPPSEAVLVGNSKGSVIQYISANDTLEVTLHDLQCEDSGRYSCTGRNGFEDNVTSFPVFIDIYIYCLRQSNQPNNTYKEIRIATDNSTVFTFVIYGYPEPTDYVLKEETGNTYLTLGTNHYNVTYTKLTPPFGMVNVTIYDAATNDSKKYIFNAKYANGDTKDLITIEVNKEMQTTVQTSDVPRVLEFTVNGKKSVDLNFGNNATIYCQVKSTDPPSQAVLLASGLGAIKEIISTSETLEISLHDLQCEDSGRYNCTGRNGFEDNVTSYPDYVDINIKCPFQLNKNNSIPRTTKVSPDENTVFTFEVYGYPEPTDYVLKIETGKTFSTMDTSRYKVTYTRLTPPFGLITLVVYDADTRGLITYVLTVTNAEGEINITINVNKEPQSTDRSSGANSADIIGGVIGGCAVLILVVILIILAFRRTKSFSDCMYPKDKNQDTPIATKGQEPEHKYEENIYDIPLENNADYVIKYTSFENAVFLHDFSTNTKPAVKSEIKVSDDKENYYTNPEESSIIDTLNDRNKEVNTEIENDYSNYPVKDKISSSHFEQDCSFEATKDYPTVELHYTLPSPDHQHALERNNVTLV